MNRQSPTFIIIGLGVSGLVSARYCLKNNYNVIILEKNKQLGGTWYNKTYPDVRLQTTRKSYAFSDFPYKQGVSLYPTGKEVLDYLEEYARTYHILKYTRFNSKVTKTTFDYKTRRWNIQYTQGDTLLEISGDYMLIASGFYQDFIHTDMIPDEIANSPNILTVRDFNQEKIDYGHFKNKRICVIGNGPTGCDLACLLYKYKPIHIKLLYRSERWLFRRYLWNKISTDPVLSRFNMKLANNIPIVVYVVILTILYYIVYIFGHGHFSFKVRTPFKPVTRQNVVLNEDIVKHIYNNNIDYIQSSNVKIDKKHVYYNNTYADYDYIILATGYKTGIDFLNMDSIPTLYNHIIHPDYPKCGFIGFAPSFNWLQVSELQIQWYLDYIKYKQPLSKKQMMNHIEIDIQTLSRSGYDYYDLATRSYEYCDKLAKRF